jgi:hypothetical protein
MEVRTDLMNEPQKPQPHSRNDGKTLLSALKWTTTLGAVSLTLAGWGLLSQAEGLNATKVGQGAALGITPGAIAEAVRATATVTTTAEAPAVTLPTATPTAAATLAATNTPAATGTPARQVAVNVVQWVNNSNGEPIAVVKDNSGVLWYVWGPDVARMEQGLDPEYQPQPVNATGRSRGS